MIMAPGVLGTYTASLSQLCVCQETAITQTPAHTLKTQSQKTAGRLIKAPTAIN